MSTGFLYKLPVEQTRWNVEGQTTTAFTWEYEDDRFNQKEVWENLGLPVAECVAAVEKSDMLKQFRRRLFTRIVPTVKDIGLWGPRVRKAYEDMGVMEFAEVDSATILENDNRVAEEFDARRFVQGQLGRA